MTERDGLDLTRKEADVLPNPAPPGNTGLLLLDPDNSSFWTGLSGTGRIYRIDFANGNTINSFVIPTNLQNDPGIPGGLGGNVGDLEIFNTQTPPGCLIDADCDDRNLCTIDTCNAATGVCSLTPIVCDDNDACNGLESCNDLTGCVAGTPLVCDDGQFCTLDSCNTATGCIFAPNPDPSCERVGGEFIGVDNSALLVAGFQANALWLLPAIAAIGIAAVVIRRIH